MSSFGKMGRPIMKWLNEKPVKITEKKENGVYYKIEEYACGHIHETIIDQKAINLIFPQIDDRFEFCSVTILPTPAKWEVK
jgi:hypothetical protein